MLLPRRARYKLLAAAAIVSATAVFAIDMPLTGTPMPAKMLSMQHEIEVVAAKKGVMLAGWTDDSATNDEDLLGWRCSFSVSTDNGKSWSTPVIYKNPNYDFSGNPTVAMDADGNMYAVCMSIVDAEQDSRGILEIATSKDRGAHWSSFQPIVKKDHGYVPDRPKLIAGGAGELNLAYTFINVDSLKPAKITYQTSTDGGKTWSEETSLSAPAAPDTEGDQGAKLVRTQQGPLLASWGRYNSPLVYFAVSKDGKHFDTPVAVDTGNADNPSPCTEMAVSRSGKWIVISRHTGHAFDQIVLVHSTDGGRTWEKLKPVSTSGINPAMVFDDNDRLHLTWTERSGQHLDTKYMTSDDAGSSFTKPESLTNGGYETIFPREDYFLNNQIGSYQTLLLTPENTMFAFWLDWRSNLPRVYYSSWTVTHK